MARAVTSEELALLRSDHQRSKLYLAIYKPGSVYTARVNQSTFNDPVTEITFDGGSGTLGTVLVGMTVLVGTSAGADDKGKVTIRKTPGASTFYISPTSEIGWADNDYLTILDDFELYSKQPSVAGETVYIDWDVAYTDQHENFSPVAVMGPHAVLKREDATVIFQPSGSGSWVLGSTISAYAWLAPGASATANLNTATPTITYNAAGWYRVSLTVTAANGKTMTGYRRVYVYDDDHLPVENFELVRCIGDYENGGWDFEVTLFDEADIADVYPGALCLLFAEDWYGSTKQSLGPITGYENLICIGRIEEETIDYDGQLGLVAFGVNGPHGWMKNISSSPAMFSATGDAPTSWSEFSSPTVDKALFHLLHWRSNATQIMDVFLSGDTRRLPEIDLDIGYIWDQLEILAERRMLAKGCCDRFGRLFVEIPGQLLATASRSGIATVMAISKDDWTGKINIESQIPQVAMAELAGIRDDTPEQVLMSRAPGSIVKKIGAFESWDGLVFDNQEHANSLSGLFLARENNPYPYVDINLAQNNRMMDVVPNQYVTLSVAPADNPRKITWTNKKLIVKRIDLQHDAKAGMLTSELECEADTDGPAGVTVIPPQPVEENIDPGVDSGEFPIFPLPNIGFPPLLPEPPKPVPYCLFSQSGPFRIIFDKARIISNGTLEESYATAYYPCQLHAHVAHPSTLTLNCKIYDLSGGTPQTTSNLEGLSVYALDAGGNILLSASYIEWTGQAHDYLRIVFYPQNPTDVHSFRIQVEHHDSEWYLGTPVRTMTIGHEYEQRDGGVAVNAEFGTTYNTSGIHIGWVSVITYDYYLRQNSDSYLGFVAGGAQTSNLPNIGLGTGTLILIKTIDYIVNGSDRSVHYAAVRDLFPDISLYAGAVSIDNTFTGGSDHKASWTADLVNYPVMFGDTPPKRLDIERAYLLNICPVGYTGE